MPDFTIPDVPQHDLDAIEARARRHRRSPEEEVRQLIHDAASEQLLISRLEEAARAVEAQLRGGGAAAGTTARAGRRYRRVDPTPRRPPV